MKKWLFRCVGMIGLMVLGVNTSAKPTENKCIQYTHPNSYTHIAKIDLGCPNVQLIVSEPTDNQLTVSQFAEKHQAKVAINGSFFRTDFFPIGLTVSGGKAWPKSRDFTNKVFFACDKQNYCTIEPKGKLSKINPKWQIAISGWQSYERKTGKFECAKSDKVGCKPNIFDTKHPRSMLGLADKGKTLYLVVIEGRQLAFSGVTLDELAEIAQSLNLDQALNLDGGGSSVLFFDGKRRNALPILQSSERPVANHLGVKLH